MYTDGDVRVQLVISKAYLYETVRDLKNLLILSIQRVTSTLVEAVRCNLRERLDRWISVAEYHAQQIICIFLFLFVGEGAIGTSQAQYSYKDASHTATPCSPRVESSGRFLSCYHIARIITFCFKYWFSGCRWIQQGLVPSH
jgi:hypothetical protein